MTTFNNEDKVSQERLPGHFVPYMLYEHHNSTVRGAAICMIRNGNAHFYYKREFDFIQKYNGVEVDLFLNPNNTSQIYLFEKDTHNFICSLDQYETVPGSAFDRSPSDELFVKNFNKVTQSLLKDFEGEISNAVKNVKAATKNIHIDQLTIMAKTKKEMDSNNVRIEMGLTDPQNPPKMFHSNKSRRKGRRKGNDDDMGLEIVSTF